MKKILIIEDDSDLVEIMQLHLQKNGYKTDYAYDGETALKKIQQSPPDLIILDVMIPKLNGQLLNQQLKSNEKTKDIPIIAVSGKVGVREVFVVDKQLTVSSFFYKPVLMSELLSEIKKLLKE